MWFVDVVVDLPWFVEKKGKLGKPRSRARQPIPGTDVDNEFLLYGDEHAIRHLRVMLHTDADEPPRDLVNDNVHRWVNLLEVASGLAAPRTATTASLGKNTSAMMVWLGRGDETTNSCQIDPQHAPVSEVDYPAAARSMAAWKPDFRVHLFYLGRFLNHELPPEVRWLNGYRLLEWHFRRGKVGLAKDKDYLAFIAQHGQALDPLLGPEQDRKGVIEEISALAARAILSRTTDPRNQNAATNLIIKTFAALECLVTSLLNEGAVEGVSFFTEQPETPPRGRDQLTGAFPVRKADIESLGGGSAPPSLADIEKRNFPNVLGGSPPTPPPVPPAQCEQADCGGGVAIIK